MLPLADLHPTNLNPLNYYSNEIKTALSEFSKGKAWATGSLAFPVQKGSLFFCYFGWTGLHFQEKLSTLMMTTLSLNMKRFSPLSLFCSDFTQPSFFTHVTRARGKNLWELYWMRRIPHHYYFHGNDNDNMQTLHILVPTIVRDTRFSQLVVSKALVTQIPRESRSL